MPSTQRRANISSSKGANQAPTRASLRADPLNTTEPASRNSAEATKTSVNTVSKIGPAAPSAARFRR